MAREIVRNPETGKPAIVMTNYQDVELHELQDAVNRAQSDLEDVTRRKEDKAAELAVLVEEEAKATVVLEDSKSEFEMGQNVVEHADGDVDAGANADGGEGANPEASDGTVAL